MMRLAPLMLLLLLPALQARNLLEHTSSKHAILRTEISTGSGNGAKVAQWFEKMAHANVQLNWQSLVAASFWPDATAGFTPDPTKHLPRLGDQTGQLNAELTTWTCPNQHGMCGTADMKDYLGQPLTLCCFDAIFLGALRTGSISLDDIKKVYTGIVKDITYLGPGSKVRVGLVLRSAERLFATKCFLCERLFVVLAPILEVA